MATAHTGIVELHYEATGDGEPLLWVHGFTGAGADWRYVFSEPPRGFRLIAPDLRGHGASPNPSARFQFRDCARDLEALLHGLKRHRIKAIGVSGGGIALLHLAKRAPDLLDSMVLVSVPPHFPAQARAIQRSASEHALPPSELELMLARHQRGAAQIATLFAHARAMADDVDDVAFTPSQLSRIETQTLIVYGDRDPLYPVSLALEMYQAMPRSYLWVVPHGGHVPVFGDAARSFAVTALAFLRGEWRQAP